MKWTKVNKMAHTLFIGVGGIGGEIVDSLAARISQRSKRDTIETICINVDSDEMGALKNVDRNDKVILPEPVRPEDIAVLDSIAKKSDWFPYDFWPGLSGVAGVGRERPKARFLLSEQQQNYRALKRKFESIRDGPGLRPPVGAPARALCVWIVTSAGGGTGSAIVCDIARIVKHVMHGTQVTCFIGGILVLPTGLGLTHADPISVANAYALLSEIEYLNSNGGIGRIGGEEVAYQGVEGSNCLFDAIFLFGLPEQLFGARIGVALHDVKGVVPSFLEMLIYSEFTLTEAQTDAPSSTEAQTGGSILEFEDLRNFLTQSGGRYCTISISELEFEIEKYKEYCAIREEKENLELKTNKEIPEFAEELKKKKKEVTTMDTITSAFVSTQKEAVTFSGNLHYQKLYFEAIKKEVADPLTEMKTDKEKLDTKITNLSEGTDEAKKAVETAKKSGGPTNWDKILGKFKGKEWDIGVNNLGQIKSQMGILDHFRKKEIDRSIRSIDTEIKDSDDKRKKIQKEINRLDAIHTNLISYIDSLQTKIDEVEGEIEAKKSKLSELKNKLEEVTGISQLYPVFSVLRDLHIDKEHFLDKIYAWRERLRSENITLHELIDYVEGSNRSNAYLDSRAGFMPLYFVTLNYKDENNPAHPIAMNLAFSRDDDYVTDYLSDTYSRLMVNGSIAGGGDFKRLSVGLKPLFPPTKWLVMQIIGGEQLSQVADLKALKDSFDQYRDKEMVFTFKEVYEEVLGKKLQKVKKN